MADRIFDDLLPEAVDFLEKIIRFPSVSGSEEDVIQFLYKAFQPVADEVELVPLFDDLVKDPEYSPVIPGIKYDGRHYLRLKVNGTGSGRSVILNAHADVVPASSRERDQFIPYQEDGAVYGRGASDDKGQIATLYLLLKVIKAKKAAFRGDVVVHIVVEEENGGNGTLAAVRSGEKADAAIVIESTALEICSSVRGAVWFRVSCSGKSGHSSSSTGTADALMMAMEVVRILKGYQGRLLAESRGIPLFAEHENPMPITFGKLHAGNWPATIADEAVLEGVLGFLPNKSRFDVMKGIDGEIKRHGGASLYDNCQIEFTYRHEAHVLDTNHPLVNVLADSCTEAGETPRVSAMIASCDSWFYSELSAIPTVVFGPGDLTAAHSNDEHIKIDQIRAAAGILFGFLGRWCGE